MFSCSVFSRVCLCLWFLCVRERTHLWRGFVTNAYKDLREEWSFLRFVAIVRMLTTLRKNQYDEMLKCHTNNLSRLFSRTFDTNQHINNTSSYRLSFFEKLIICRGLKSCLTQKVSPIEI